MQFVKVGHAVVHYALRPAPSDLAGAPVMVFLNSLGTDMRIWERVICHFQDYQILQVDKRGHGLSSGTADSVDELALDVAALMDRYGMSNAVVCGVSIGGMIAQSLGVQRPDLVSHLVLCCTGLPLLIPCQTRSLRFWKMLGICPVLKLLMNWLPACVVSWRKQRDLSVRTSCVEWSHQCARSRSALVG